MFEQYVQFNDETQAELDKTLESIQSDLTVPIVPKELTTDLDIKQSHKLANASLREVSRLIKESKRVVSKNEIALDVLYNRWKPIFDQKNFIFLTKVFFTLLLQITRLL